MAGFTLCSELALVLVFLLVATQAIHRRVAQALQILVASHAFDDSRSMRIAQRKTGAFMFEPAPRRFPVLLVVAIAARLADVQVVLSSFLWQL